MRQASVAVIFRVKHERYAYSCFFSFAYRIQLFLSDFILYSCFSL